MVRMNLIQKISPKDLERERRFFYRLTPLSKRMRFMAAVGEPSEAQLRRLVSPDPDKELALAWVIDGEFAAVVRYAILDPVERNAEYAIVVADQFQSQGIGKTLSLALIQAAREAGVRSLQAECYADNAPVLALFRSLGFSVSRHPEDQSLCFVSLRLDSEGANAQHNTRYQ